MPELDGEFHRLSYNQASPQLHQTLAPWPKCQQIELKLGSSRLHPQTSTSHWSSQQRLTHGQCEKRAAEWDASSCCLHITDERKRDSAQYNIITRCSFIGKWILTARLSVGVISEIGVLWDCCRSPLVPSPSFSRCSSAALTSTVREKSSGQALHLFWCVFACSLCFN